MRFNRTRKSQNIEDRRGRGPGRPMSRGGSGMKIGGGGAIILLILGLFLGQDLIGPLMGGGGSVPQLNPQQRQTSDGQPKLRTEDQATAFIANVLGTTEDVWIDLFRNAGKQYRAPKLVLFNNGVNSACGFTSSAAGPFYCPGDSQVYIDLGFFRELERMGAGGDFAQAYVIAHEVGHHVQNQLGVSMAVQRRMRQVPKVQANKLSVLAELQADCYAGVWAHHAHKRFQMLEPGDLEEGMNAASRIGDDVMLRNAGRRVHPDMFTHGSSKQRQQWLYRGLELGDPNKCDTFQSNV